MLMKRLIPCLDIRDGQVTKGIQFMGNRDLGDPVPLAQRYYLEGADEIVIYDITASIEKRPPDQRTIARIADQVFIPICVGGGIQSFADAAQVIRAGAEKVSLNSSAPKNPKLISEISTHFGVQAVVLSLDVLRDQSCPSGYRVFIHGGRTPTEWDMLDWITYALPLGVGEICLNSIDEDGRRQGYDIQMIEVVRNAVNVPIIASGGAGSIQDLAKAFDSGADAALVASLVHLDGHTCSALKSALGSQGYPMRLSL